MFKQKFKKQISSSLMQLVCIWNIYLISFLAGVIAILTYFYFWICSEYSLRNSRILLQHTLPCFTIYNSWFLMWFCAM